MKRALALRSWPRGRPNDKRRPGGRPPKLTPRDDEAIRSKSRQPGATLGTIADAVNARRRRDPALRSEAEERLRRAFGRAPTKQQVDGDRKLNVSMHTVRRFMVQHRIPLPASTLAARARRRKSSAKRRKPSDRTR